MCKNQSKGLNGGAIVGIVNILEMVLSFYVLFCIKQYSKKKDNKNDF